MKAKYLYKIPILTGLILSFAFLFLCIMPLGCTKKSTKSEEPQTADWVTEPGIRVEDGISPCTIWINDTYYMYFTAEEGIKLATSSDGLTWSDPVTVLPPGGPGSLDQRASNPAVLPLSGGGYRMIYEGSDLIQPVRRLFSAVSQDGIEWTKEGLRLESEGTPDSGFASVPDLMALSDTTWIMYYTGDGNRKGSEPFNTIRAAISPNQGEYWWRVDLRGFSSNCMDPDIIALPGGKFRMFYTTPYPPGSTGNLRIVSATSSDGLKWTQEEGVRVLPWGEYVNVMDPDVVQLPDGSYRMYYSGMRADGTSDILSAIPQ